MTHEERVAQVRVHIAAGQTKKALRETWDLTLESLRRHDTEALKSSHALALEIAAVAEGKVRESAAQLAAYAQSCIDGVGLDTSSGNFLQRLFFRQAPATRRCPDCAETIQAAARVCRYCGRRFDSPTADGTEPTDQEPRS